MAREGFAAFHGRDVKTVKLADVTAKDGIGVAAWAAYHMQYKNPAAPKPQGKNAPNGVCRDFLAGKCTRGSSCKFAHTPSPGPAPADKTKAKGKGKGQRDCVFWLAFGKCRDGDACANLHDPNKAGTGIKGAPRPADAPTQG